MRWRFPVNLLLSMSFAFVVCGARWSAADARGHVHAESDAAYVGINSSHGRGEVFRTVIPVTPFEKFTRAFHALNKRIKVLTGVTLFTGAEDRGDRILYIRTTAIWLAGPKDDKESNLRLLYNMWKAVNDDMPVAVYVLDTAGNRHMGLRDQ